MIEYYENDDLDKEEYYYQLDESEWIDYVDVCVDCGCLHCGHKIESGFELNDYHSCIYCEGKV